MDFHLKQWRNQQQHQHESEEEEEQQQHSAKMPKLLLNHPPPPHHHHQPQEQNYPSGSTSTPLPLFVPEPNSKISSNLSAFPDSTTAPPATTRFPRMGGSGYFSLAQWQELELQALIYRYILAGSAIPHELLQPIKKSLLHSPQYFFHHPLQHYSCYQPALLQTGYWGRASMDPEPGRCRRTDGKKWRCSRDVVAGQKYCERHVHRGRNRSRKPVEIPTPNSSSTTPTSTTNTSSTGIGAGSVGGSTGGATSGAFNSTASPIVGPPLASVTSGTGFSFSGQSPSSDLLHLNNSSSDSKPEMKSLFLGPQNEVANRSDGHILRHFFDDWPRSRQDADNGTSLTISMPGNSSSDVSLKLSTGNGEEPAGPRVNEREQPQVNWTGGWGTNQVASMGGPLAEALRSSTSNSSPTSVLHQLPRGSASETSYVST